MTTDLLELKKKLRGVTIEESSHYSRDDGMCVMECVAWLANEQHSDHPKCACPLATGLAIEINDSISDDKLRTRLLKPLALMLLNSKGDEKVLEKREAAIVNWLIQRELKSKDGFYLNKEEKKLLKSFGCIRDRKDAKKVIKQIHDAQAELEDCEDNWREDELDFDSSAAYAALNEFASHGLDTNGILDDDNVKDSVKLLRRILAIK